MNVPDAPARTAGLRAALVSLSSVLVGALLVMGIVALFAIWSMDRAWRDATDSTAVIRVLATDAAQTQIEFKIGVQEWKNVLLRGADPEDFAQYRRAFESRQVGVADRLGRLEAGAAALGFAETAAEIAAVRSLHAMQLSAYRQALMTGIEQTPDPELPVLGIEAARRVDRAVRGIDRELEQRIDGMRGMVDARVSAEFEALATRLTQRYQKLRAVLIGLLLASFAVSGSALYGAFRMTRVA